MWPIRLLQIVGIVTIIFGILTAQMILVVAGIGFGVHALIEFRFYEIYKALCDEMEEEEKQ